MIEKNKEYDFDIIDNGMNFEGISKKYDKVVFIPGSITGEKVRAKVIKDTKSYSIAKLEEIYKISKDRVEPFCSSFKRCGGCSLRHIKYEKTLEMKQNAVQSLVNKILKNEIEVQKTLGMEKTYYYRNKAQYPVGKNSEGKAQIGVFANRTHEIIPIQECYIQNKKSQEVAKFVIEFINANNISVYNEKTRKGLVRHIVTKVGVKTNEIMCVLVINGKEIPKEKELVTEVTKKFPEVKTIVKNINTQNTNVVMGKENIVIYGNGYIKDQLGKYIFKISPHSFYQVNPIQAENLYNIGVQAANIDKNDIVFDLYCGIGTISLFMAQYAKKVYGIEIVEQAIQDAKENAKINNIENAEFIAGDVENVLDDLINVKKVIPDVIMIDPPRKGMDNKSVENILNIKPKKLVYISCNPATLVRDLAKFEEEYEVKTIKPVDMFPFTSHVECVTVLSLKESGEA